MKKESVVVEVSDKNVISFSAYSDQNVFEFINALQTRFPGYVKITDFRLDRVELPAQQSLRDISEGKVPALIRGVVEFTWYTLKKPESTESLSEVAS
jgi:hypothetical protein